MILLTKSPGSPKKLPGNPPGSYQKFQGRIPYNIFVAILVETMTQKDILKLTDLFKGKGDSQKKTHRLALHDAQYSAIKNQLHKRNKVKSAAESVVHEW